jgi:hypothetical protein
MRVRRAVAAALLAAVSAVGIVALTTTPASATGKCVEISPGEFAC